MRRILTATMLLLALATIEAQASPVLIQSGQSATFNFNNFALIGTNGPVNGQSVVFGFLSYRYATLLTPADYWTMEIFSDPNASPVSTFTSNSEGNGSSGGGIGLTLAPIPLIGAVRISITGGSMEITRVGMQLVSQGLLYEDSILLDPSGLNPLAVPESPAPFLIGVGLLGVFAVGRNRLLAGS